MKITKLRKTLELAKERLGNCEKLLLENPDSFFHKLLVSNIKLEIEHLKTEIIEAQPPKAYSPSQEQVL